MNGVEGMSGMALDILIVGAGVAGMEAARVAAAEGAKVLVVERMGPGGQVATVDRITNFPGHDEIGGFELGPMLQDAADEAGAEFGLSEVAALAPVAGGWRAAVDGTPLDARCVILACGSERRALGVPGESAYAGRGVSHCASCDGGFFRGETVVVVGGGDSALDEALVLAPMVGSVVLVLRWTEFRATQGQETALAGQPNITVLRETEVIEVQGDDSGMTGVVLRDGGGTRVLPARGLFVYVGLTPRTALAEGLAERDQDGRLVVSGRMETTAPGLFAAGDIRQGSRALLAEALEDGQKAARAALGFLQTGLAAGQQG